MATPEIDSGSDEGTRAQRGDASWTRSHGWWTEATGSKPRTSATTAVPLCVPVPPGLPPAGFHARMHPRGGGGGRPGTDPLCPVRRKGCGSCEACPPSFRLSRASLLGGSSLTSWARGSPPATGPSISAPLSRLLTGTGLPPLSRVRPNEGHRAKYLVRDLGSLHPAVKPWPPGVPCVGALGKGHRAGRDRISPVVLQSLGQRGQGTDPGSH